MKIENIEITDDLLQVIEENNFVVFAGAGVSMGHPTKLPSFESLVNEIGKYTGEINNNEEISCEVQLGKWKRKGINVHKKASEILFKEELKYNNLHKYIINLFSKKENIRIITTNYDEMFEQCLQSIDIGSVRKYSAPALPLGKDFNGIVHIHGIVGDTNSMILTDEDFGKAYMTEQYVSRFLTDVFQTYDVIFIGYSYNDMIVEYLTKGMSPYKSKKRFIFAGKNDDRLKNLGMETIEFGEGRFDILYKLIERIGKINSRSLIDWKCYVNEFSNNPPTDIQSIAEFEYCLYHPKNNIVLLTNIHGVQWYEWLDERKVFEKALIGQENNTETIYIKWIDWIIDEFVGKNDKLIFDLIYKYSWNSNKYFISKIIQSIRAKEISSDIISKYVMLIIDHIELQHEIYTLLDIAHDKKLIELEFVIFKKLYEEKVKVDREMYGSDLEITVRLFGEKGLCKLLFNMIKDDIKRHMPKELLCFFKEKVKSIYEKLNVLSRVDEKKRSIIKLWFFIREYRST